jgi:ribose 1,5-bisphosphate isomerase
MAVDSRHVAACFLRNDGHVLLCRRTKAADAFPGRWTVPTIDVTDDTPADDALDDEARDDDALDGDALDDLASEIQASTGLAADALEQIREGTTIELADDTLDRPWHVHPVLFDCATRETTLAGPFEDDQWVQPPEILRRETLPELWAAYERIAPSVRSVGADGDHGAAYVSHRALEVLRDRAAVLRTEAVDGDDAWAEVADLAGRLRNVRPTMAVLANRVNRVMATAERDAGGLEQTAMDELNRAVRADREAADRAAALVDDRSVLTLSTSGTVRRALAAADTIEVFVAESRPAREGVGLAESLLEDNPVTLHSDAAIGHVLATESVDCVLVGADAVLPDGRVVNKTGTRLAAVAAAHEGIPVFVACATDKVRTDDALRLESGPRSALYDGDAGLAVANPTFDVTPPHLVDAVVTERGELDATDMADVAAELEANEAWGESGDAARQGGTAATGEAADRTGPDREVGESDGWGRDSDDR